MNWLLVSAACIHCRGPYGCIFMAGNMSCIHNVVAVIATVGLLGKEGLVVRKNIVVAIVYTLLAGAIVLLSSSLILRMF